MQRQGSFLQAEYARKKRPTWRDKFLAEMEAVVPWARLVQRLGWSACCGSTLCSNGTGWRTRRSRMRCTTVKHCAALPASS